MRRDVGYYVEASVEQVYHAYLQAAKNKPFERDCKEEPYCTIGFGVNYSFKYNMNGGACNIHFAPSGSGTAVNMRFSIAQLAGARYEKYAEDLTASMQRYLPVAVCPASYDMDEFLLPQNQVKPGMAQPAAVQVTGGKFCPQCGTPAARERVCPNCNAPAEESARFCSSCGTQL